VEAHKQRLCTLYRPNGCLIRSLTLRPNAPGLAWLLLSHRLRPVDTTPAP
jgi:hypothetical protein